MSEPLVVAEELEREYRMGPEPVRVLRGVSLTVNAGESIAIIGASGVGKSTLLHLLGTLDRPTSGRVIFDGEDVSPGPTRPWRACAAPRWASSSSSTTCSAR